MCLLLMILAMKAKVISDIAMKNHVVLMVIFPIGWPKTVLWLYPYTTGFPTDSQPWFSVNSYNFYGK